jgi:hypothetical protein
VRFLIFLLLPALAFAHGAADPTAAPAAVWTPPDHRVPRGAGPSEATANTEPIVVVDGSGPDAVVVVQAHKVELRDLLHELAALAGVNLVLSDRIGGSVTVDLHALPARDAFYALTSLNQLCPTTASSPTLLMLRPRARTKDDGCAWCRFDQPWPG